MQNNGTITLSTATTTGFTYNSTYYIVIDGSLGNNCRFDIKTETMINGNGVALLPPCTVLSISLKEFNATAEKDGTVSLKWITASKRNNDYYTIERSKDGVNFEVISIVEGSGNSTHEMDYIVTNFLPHAGFNYYRLKKQITMGNLNILNLLL